jgi:SOS response regulatory protein OraA/RecX
MMQSVNYPPAIRQLQDKIDSLLHSMESAENYEEYLNKLHDSELIDETAFVRFTAENNRALGHMVRQLDDTYLALKIALSNFHK